MRLDDAKDFSPNENTILNKALNDMGWVSQNTAILIVHGIGSQLPLETLDSFGRGLVKQYKNTYNEILELAHEIVSKPDDFDKTWFDNVLRLSKAGSEYHIDIYEYYWAKYTEDKAEWNDLSKWLRGVVKGADKFYKRNEQLGQLYKDKSLFFNKQTGKFIPWRYRFFLNTISKTFFVIDRLIDLFIWLVGLFPIIGGFARKMAESYTRSLIQNLTNLLADVVIYNVVDPKSKFFAVRINIKEGATGALRYLLEKVNRVDDKTCECNLADVIKKHRSDMAFADKEEKAKLKNNLDKILSMAELSYPSVIVAGHSLGTQVSYDAINTINLKINKGEICTYDSKGNCILGEKLPISKQLRGFITFGSPLDKIIFFLRENIPDEAYLRQQFLDDFFGFKQRNISRAYNNTTTNKWYTKAECGLTRFLDNVQWRNYYDDKDYVSGGLDYYTNLINVNCQFKAGTFGFTHSNYWTYDPFYEDIINNFLK